MSPFNIVGLCFFFIDCAKTFQTPLDLIQHFMNKGWGNDWLIDPCIPLGSEGSCCSGWGRCKVGSVWQWRDALTADRFPALTEDLLAALCCEMCVCGAPEVWQDSCVWCAEWGEHLAPKKFYPYVYFVARTWIKNSHFYLFYLYVIYFLNTDIL